MPTGAIAYMATITYGAIIVPILQDFTPNDVHHIVNHSESVFLFTSDSIWENLEEEKLTGTARSFFAHRLPLPLSAGRRNYSEVSGTPQ